MAKQKSVDEHNEHLVMLEERKVKALEKIANTIDALTPVSYTHLRAHET